MPLALVSDIHGSDAAFAAAADELASRGLERSVETSDAEVERPLGGAG